MAAPVRRPGPAPVERCTASCGRSRRGCCGSSSPSGSRPPWACSSTRSAAETCSRTRAGGTCCSAIGGVSRSTPTGPCWRAGRGPTCGPAWPTRWPSPCPPRSSRSASPRSRRTPSRGSISRDARPLFIATVALLAIPLQIALIPLLQLYNFGAHLTIPWLDKTITVFPDLDLTGTTNAVWLSHTAFGMPFAIFLLHNYISSLPPGPVRGGAHRRGRPLQDLLAPGAAAVGAGARRVRHLPVPVDLERLPRRQRDDPPQPGGATRRRSSSPTWRQAVKGRRSTCSPPGRSSRRPSPGRLLPPPALLRARHPRRLRQGLTDPRPVCVSVCAVRARTR